MEDDKPLRLYPWEYEAGMLHHASGASAEECQRQVMIRWLEKGDARPIAYMMAYGIAPHPDVLKMLAGMMYPEYTPLEKFPDGEIGPADYNYRIKIKSNRSTKGKGGRPKGGDPETDVVDFELAWRVREKTQSGLSREDAIAEVAEERCVSERRVTTASNRCGGERQLAFWPITAKRDLRTPK